MLEGLAILWFLGGLWRIFRLARFFQIEEYMNGRYWRWLLKHRERWGWRRAGMAWAAALVIGFLLSEAPGDTLLAVVYTVTGLVAVWQPGEREVKKRFRPTQRALRLLIAAFALFGAATVFGALVIRALNLGGLRPLLYALTAGAGLALYLVSPLFLIAGNVAAYPVEALLRRVFLRRARRELGRLHPTVIGITGSYGKTSTKHYLAHILEGRYQVAATPRSYNTLMGVCLAINTALRERRDLDYFIVEMGAYVEGEIADICALTRPQISIVTAVGPQHLERFGSLEAVAQAKFEIVAALPEDGAAVLNGDDPLVRAMAARVPARTCLLVSQQEGDEDAVRLVAREVRESLHGLDFDVADTVTGAERHFHAPLYGRHNVTNVLLATAAARQVGMSLGEIALRVATLEPFEHRLQRRIQGGLTILDDAYSANPVGAVNALRVLAMHHRGRRILVTPGMVELGELQEAENRRLGETAAQYCTHIALVGSAQTRPIYEGAIAAGFNRDHLLVFETHAEAVAWLQAKAQAGDTILFLNDLPDTYL